MNEEIRETFPLSGKIDSAAALKKALKEMNKERTIHRWKYKEMTRILDPISDDTFHVWRDGLRMHTEYWTKITPPSGEVEQDQTLHLAKQGEQAFVAFAETEEKRKRDIFTRMRYGKFLTKYHPEMDNEEVKRLVSDFEYQHGAPPELKFGETEEDFVHAIKDGPSDSCQADSFYSSDRFPYKGHAHPAVCYAAGDIAVAWIESPCGKVTARALINKKNKYHSRPYGDTERIERLLAEQGFEKQRGALIGCRLKVIENRNGDGWLMPYVDAGIASGGGSLYAERDGDYWMLNDNSDGVNTSCGYENKGITTETEDEEEDDEPEFGHCERCGEALWNGSDYVYSDHESCSYCSSCADRHWTYAIVTVMRNSHHNFDYVRQNNVTYIDCLDEHVWDDILGDLDVIKDEHRDEWINLDDAVTCIYDEEHHHIDDCVEVGENSDGTIWLHKEELTNRNLAGKIYYDEDDKPFWFESDEIQNWIEAGDELDKYALKQDKEAGQEALPLVTVSQEKTCPDGTWQEIYRWMQSRGVLFDYEESSMECNFDMYATPNQYRIRPNQPDVPNWRNVFLEAQRCGVKFECRRNKDPDEWIQGEWFFNGESMSIYRTQETEVIQEVTDERMAA